MDDRDAADAGVTRPSHQGYEPAGVLHGEPNDLTRFSHSGSGAYVDPTVN